MSRVGKLPIAIPNGVKVDIKGNVVNVSGPLGNLEISVSNDVSLSLEEGKLLVKKSNDSVSAKQKWGLYRNKINNMVVGVSTGFKKVLLINGVGYRASFDEPILTLILGYSHHIKVAVPTKLLQVKCPSPTQIEISSYDKEFLGKFAAEVRALRGPEPYKGKGIKYQDENIVRKEGKKK